MFDLNIGDMGGMQDMLMQMLMSDPELAAGLKNPKVMKAFSSMMGGGGENTPEMQDPEVQAFMKKFQEKMGPMMGMMGGMGGGKKFFSHFSPRSNLSIFYFPIRWCWRHGRYGRHGWYGRHGRYAMLAVVVADNA